MFRRFFEFYPLVVWALMLLVVVRPLRLGWRGSVLVAGVLLAASQKFLIYRFFGGDSFVPDLPELFVNVTGWSYSAAMILFALACAWGVVGGVWGLVHRSSRPLPRRAIGALAAVAMLVAGWGIWEGVRIPDVRRVEIALEGLPPAFDGFRLVQLTDLHCSSAARKARTAGIVRKVNALKPDLVCITGDFVDGPPSLRADDLSPLADLRAPFGVFGCAGNHEYYSDYVAWRPVFTSFGIVMLDNAHRVLEKDGARLVLGGVTDPAAVRNRRADRTVERLEPPDAAKAFAGAPADACRILLQHRPRLPPKMSRAEPVQLQLSGHTHGGMMPGIAFLVGRLENNNGFVRGLYRLGGGFLYVSPGTGQWAGFPLRLGVPAEITEIILRPRPRPLSLPPESGILSSRFPVTSK